MHHPRYKSNKDVGQRQHHKCCRDDWNHTVVVPFDHRVDKSLTDQRSGQRSGRAGKSQQKERKQRLFSLPEVSGK